MAMVAAMSQAVRDGKTEEVKKLLECDRGLLDTKDTQGAESLPPLLEAVRSNRVKVVKLLLEQGVDVNVADASGWTGLFYACNSGHETVLRMLLKAGANASIPTVSGWTPLMRAAYHGRTDFVRILLEHGSQVRGRERKRGRVVFGQGVGVGAESDRSRPPSLSKVSGA